MRALSMNDSALIIFLTALIVLGGCSKSKTPIAEHHEEIKSAAQQVLIDPTAARNAGIAVSVAGPASLKEALSLYGVVQPNAERMRTVVARFPGVVKSVTAALGDHVKAGDVLATVESNDSLQTYAIKASIAGVITERSINSSETVGEHPLFTITDLSTVWVELSLFSRDRTQIKIGQSVNVRAVQDGPAATGHVVWLSAVGSAATQSLSARVQLDNAQGLWTPGLYVIGDVALGEESVPLAVQSSALQNLDGKTVVFTETKDGYAARAVKTGRSDGVLTEVLEGVSPNERYVSANSFVIKADIEKSSAEHDE